MSEIASKHQKLEEAQKDSAQSLRGNMALPTLNFGLMALRTVRL